MRPFYLASIFFYLPPLLHLLVRFLRIVFRIFQLLVVYPFRLLVIRRFPMLYPAKGEKILNLLIAPLNSAVGMMEYYVRAPRNYTLGFFYFVLSAWFLVSALTAGRPLNLTADGFPFLFVLLTFYSIQKESRTALNMSEFLRANPRMNPASFFKTYYQRLGPFDLPFPDPMKTARLKPEAVSFKTNKRAKQTRRVFIPVVWDTAHLAHACLKALKYVGKEYAREVFDLMANMWGKRTLQLFNASLEVTGAEKLQNLNGKILLVLNHKSQLDFALTFFALSGVRLGRGREVRTRFITAKDHFVDNFFVYEILGVGKLIEAVDMVFIDRKRSGKGFQDLQQAAGFLAQKEIDIAIFPQGTRAEGNIDRSGKRRDAGYYTTVSPRDISSDLAHLRKGTAYLAVDSLIELSRTTREDLHLVFVGISGSATALAKQSLEIQTETDIRYIIGDPMTLSPTLVTGCRKPEGSLTQGSSTQGPGARTAGEKKYLELVNWIHHEIDRRLSDCLEIHENLKRRFLLDLQGQLRYSRESLQMVETAFDGAAGQYPFIYQILDRIYACPLPEWNRSLSELAQLIADGSSEERLRQLRDQVTLKLLESLKARVHGKKVKKRELKEVKAKP